MVAVATVDAYHARMREVLAPYGIDVDSEEVDGVPVAQVRPHRYLLIEKNRGGSPTWWLTTHASRTLAVRYVEGQEYPADYEVMALYDLWNGQEYAAIETVKFEPVPE